MFHNAAQEKERIAIHEEKKDQAVDDEDDTFIRKLHKQRKIVRCPRDLFRDWR